MQDVYPEWTTWFQRVPRPRLGIKYTPRPELYPAFIVPASSNHLISHHNHPGSLLLPNLHLLEGIAWSAQNERLGFLTHRSLYMLHFRTIHQYQYRGRRVAVTFSRCWLLLCKKWSCPSEWEIRHRRPPSALHLSMFCRDYAEVSSPPIDPSK